MRTLLQGGRIFWSRDTFLIKTRAYLLNNCFWDDTGHHKRIDEDLHWGINCFLVCLSGQDAVQALTLVSQCLQAFAAEARTAALTECSANGSGCRYLQHLEWQIREEVALGRPEEKRLLCPNKEPRANVGRCRRIQRCALCTASSQAMSCKTSDPKIVIYPLHRRRPYTLTALSAPVYRQNSSNT